MSLVGAAVNLNLGGSAGSGSGVAGMTPLLPGAVEVAGSITPAIIINYTALLQNGSLLVEHCSCGGETCSIHKR